MLAATLVVAAGLGGCGGAQDAPKATQVVAKVNDREVSVHQLNFVLQHRPGIAPQQVAQARREALGQLVQQELIVQEAIASKTDREPIVQQQLEAARREILAKAYLQKVAAGVGTPDRESVDRFYGEQPELFRKRRIWRFAEIGLPNRPQDWPELEKALASARTIGEAARILKDRGIEQPVVHDVRRGSEDMPLEALPRFAALADGDVVIYQRPPGIVIAQLLGSTPAPVEQAQARPAIEAFLLNRARSEAVQAELKRIERGAKVVYTGEFAPVSDAAQPQPERAGEAAPVKVANDDGASFAANRGRLQ